METSTIVYLKSGKFSIHPARGPILMCKKDEVVEIDSRHAEVLSEHKWAEILETEEPIQDPDDPIVPPWKQEDWDPEADDVKDRLEAYGLEVFDLDIDKRKSVSKIIEQLEDLEELTGDN